MSLLTEFETRGAWLFRYRSFLALAGLPLLLAGLQSFTYFGQSHRSDEVWNAICLVISFSGFGLRFFTVGYVPRGTSGRNTREQLAETLNTTGIYSIMRHPLYLGNAVMALGVFMFFHTWWIVALAACICALYYERIMFAEESFLRKRFGDGFERWAATTPAIIPAWTQWKRPQLPFSWRSALRREYTGFFVLTTTFASLEIAGDWIAEGHMRLDVPWLIIAGGGAVIYLSLRGLKKQTHLLDEAGR